MISQVRKRDGRLVEFEPQKIRNAVFKAAIDVGKEKPHARHISEGITHEVVARLEFKFKKLIPSVEDIQDIVEETLMENGYTDIAKAYILYREKRSEIRDIKNIFGVKDDLKLGINAIKVLKERYLLKDENDNVIETPSEMFRRVARTIARVERRYKKSPAYIKKLEDEFYRIMANREFLPNSPTLMNAGTEISQLSACFVLPVEDSMEGIFEAVKRMAIIQKSGGGTGFNFSHLRPEGDIVKSTKGVASGPVSFMRVFNVATEVTKQGGKRRGANMGILRYDHPDIVKFITSKSKEGMLRNFNISVAVDNKFMNAVIKGKNYNLINPRTKKPVGRVNARDIFNLIVTTAWAHGDPGLVFLDTINKKNPTPDLGVIEATNPCGETPLLYYESCNLGSINLSKMITTGKKPEIDWKKLEKTVKLAVRFLDNVIDANKYPFREIEIMTKANRKIGLGVMGFAELLIQLGIPYDSQRAVKIAEKVMRFITRTARNESINLGKEKGNFPNKSRSIYKKYRYMRNATLTTIAPTGTISIIAGCSSGIEPIFAISFVRNVLGGAKLVETNQYFEKLMKKRNLYSNELMVKISKTGTIQHLNLPNDIKRVFKTALDIKPEWHVKIQAAFQKYTDNAVSKTINLPHNATPEDVRRAFILAWKLGCKGITVYRYGSKKEQVLKIEPEEHISVQSEYSGGCPKEPYCEV